RCPNAHAMEKMRRKGFITNFDVSAGVLYRPYHLCGAETAMSIICAGLLGVPTGSPEILPYTDIICSARRNMKAGELVGPKFDSGWNRDFACSLVRGTRLSPDAPIPFFMLEGNRLSKDVPCGTVITLDMVEEPKDSALWGLRREQDKVFADMLK
ncbi:MAG: flagellar biosynthesis protein FlgA, partial [Oscillospiraceae bacterium]|nr:flagellar biosynthesis protein FlgA [Oscillospiraceae bacterium]